MFLFGGYYSTDLGCFARDFGEFQDWVKCSSWGDVVGAVMSVVSLAGDGLNGVVASALLGTWLFCDRFRCIFPRKGKRGTRCWSKVTVYGTIAPPPLPVISL